MNYTLVTGSCGRLGGAFVRLLAEKGEPLFLTGREEGRLARLAEDLRAKYPQLQIEYFPCDLTDEKSRKRFFAYADGGKARFSRLVYVAGADVQKGFEKYSEEKLILQTRVNFEGAVSFTRAVMARSDLDGTAEFLAVGSVSGLYPMPYFALYSATKKALWQFYAALRTEVRGKAKVTCVLPGAIPTREDVKEYIAKQGLWGKLAALPPEKVAKKSLKAVQKNRRSVVVGFWNKLMHIFTAPVPLPLKLKFIAKKWSKTEKDAF